MCIGLAVSPRHLVLIPLPDTAATEALAAIDRLERRASLDLLGVALVERHADGTLDVALVPHQVSSQIDGAAWTWLLGGILEDLDPAGRDDDRDGPFGGAVFSDSFVSEIREVVAHARRSLALVVAGFDAAAIVSELRGLPGAKLVYGVLPKPVFDRLVTRPGRTRGPSGPGTHH